MSPNFVLKCTLISQNKPLLVYILQLKESMKSKLTGLNTYLL